VSFLVTPIERLDPSLFIFIRVYNFVICPGSHACRTNKILCTAIYEADEFVVWTKKGNDAQDAMTSRMPDAADLVEPTLDGIDNGREAMGIVKRMRQEYRGTRVQSYGNFAATDLIYPFGHFV